MTTYLYVYLIAIIILTLTSESVPYYVKIVILGLVLFWVYKFGKKHNFDWGNFFMDSILCYINFIIFFSLFYIVLSLVFPHSIHLKLCNH